MTRRRPVAIVAVVLSVGLVLSAVGSCDGPGHRQDQGEPRCAARPFLAPYSTVDPCAPEVVLTSAAEVIFSYRPDRQPDSGEAFLAAAPLIAPDYLNRIGVSAAALASTTASTWARWSALHIAVTATSHVTADDHPADTSNRVSRVIAVTQRPGDEPPHVLTVYMQATRDNVNLPWLVTGLEVK